MNENEAIQAVLAEPYAATTPIGVLADRVIQHLPPIDYPPAASERRKRIALKIAQRALTQGTLRD